MMTAAQLDIRVDGLRHPSHPPSNYQVEKQIGHLISIS
jgi:hypothetical protein